MNCITKRSRPACAPFHAKRWHQVDVTRANINRSVDFGRLAVGNVEPWPAAYLSPLAARVTDTYHIPSPSKSLLTKQ